MPWNKITVPNGNFLTFSMRLWNLRSAIAESKSGRAWVYGSISKKEILGVRLSHQPQARSHGRVVKCCALSYRSMRLQGYIMISGSRLRLVS